MKWINVKKRKPPCSRDKDAPGYPVLIWPPNPQPEQDGVDGFAYYGKRATGRPAFYLYGAELIGVTHWMPMPKRPRKP